MATVELDEDQALSVKTLALGLDAAWLVLTASGIVLTQVGFACLEAAYARRKDERAILFKNLLDHSIASICWYFIGWRIFTRLGWFATNDVVLTYPRILQQFGFEITTSSIVSASVLGRCRLDTYICFSAFLASISYPMLAFACWNPQGPLAMIGYKDFGGGGVVHGFGGFCGIIASRFCGKRYGVGSNSPAGAPLVAVGGLVLYIAWFFVNAGSSGGITTEAAIRSAGRAALNTGLCAGSASLMGYLICKYRKRFDLHLLVNSLISGLIIITAPCGFVEPFVAVLLGMISPLVVLQGSKFVKETLEIEDPMDAIPIHCANGLLGVLFVGIFHSTDGLVYSFSVKLLSVQTMGAIVIVCWAIMTAVPFFGLANRLNCLAYTEVEQSTGLDIVYFGEYVKEGEEKSKPQYQNPALESI
jgi:ammonium transporter, Amt family